MLRKYAYRSTIVLLILLLTAGSLFGYRYFADLVAPITDNAWFVAKEYTFYSPSFGMVKEILTTENSQVVAGQQLFSLDDADVRHAIEINDAKLQLAAQKMERYKSEYTMWQQKIQQLRDTYSVTLQNKNKTGALKNMSASLDEAEALFAAAKETLSQNASSTLQELSAAEQEQRVLQQQLRQTSLITPLSGVISKIYVTADQYLPQGKPLFNVMATNDLQVIAAFPYDVWSKLQDRNMVYIRLQNQGSSSKLLSGTIVAKLAQSCQRYDNCLSKTDAFPVIINLNTAPHDPEHTKQQDQDVPLVANLPVTVVAVLQDNKISAWRKWWLS